MKRCVLTGLAHIGADDGHPCQPDDPFPIKAEQLGFALEFGPHPWGDHDGNVWLSVLRDGRSVGFVQLAGIAHTFTEGWRQ